MERRWRPFSGLEACLGEVGGGVGLFEDLFGEFGVHGDGVTHELEELFVVLERRAQAERTVPEGVGLVGVVLRTCW